MNIEKCSKGSIWRKWDLHVHTPASYCRNNLGDWDRYISNLIDAIKKHKISAIALGGLATNLAFLIPGTIEFLKEINKKILKKIEVKFLNISNRTIF